MNKRKMFVICYVILMPLLITLSYFLPRSQLLNFENQYNPFKTEVEEFVKEDKSEDAKEKIFKETKLGRYSTFKTTIYEVKHTTKDLTEYLVYLDNPKKTNIENLKGQMYLYTDFSEYKSQVSKQDKMSLNPKTEDERKNNIFTVRHNRKFPFFNGVMIIRRPQFALLLEYDELLDNKTRTVKHMDLIYIDQRSIIYDVA